MRGNEFEAALEGMDANFNVRGQLFEEKKKLLWREFHTVNSDIWAKTCRNILENDERFPTIKRFKEVLQSNFFDNQQQRLMPNTIRCVLCDGSGFISTLKFISGKIAGEYVFRCSCQNGAARSQEIPIWTKDFEAKGHKLKTDLLETCTSGKRQVDLELIGKSI